MTGVQTCALPIFAVTSGSAYETDIVGGYVLAGATKHIVAKIPPATCKSLGPLKIVMKSDRIGTVERTFAWDASRCGK